MKQGVLESPPMKKSFLVPCFSAALFLISGSVQADNICHSRAEARRHSALSLARLSYMNRVKSCQTMSSPDRAEQCIQVARVVFERDSQSARARYARDVRACRTES